MTTSKDDVYSCDSIRVLSGLEAIRKRPGMYVGDVRDGSALHHLLWELVSNALDEHLGGRATRIRVSVEGQIAEVEDDGRGMPIAPDAKLGLPLVEVALTQLHSSPTLDGHFPHIHVGRFGVGLAIVNALSEELEVEVRRDGWSWRQRYERGVPLGPLDRGERSERTGTRIRFRADRSILGDVPFDRDAIRRRLVELAAFNPALTFELMAEKIREPRGISAFLYPDPSVEISDPFAMRSFPDGVLVEAALGWNRDPHGSIRSFVGQTETEEGGTHENGFLKGIVAAITAQPALRGRLPRRAFRAARRLAGLQAVVHVDLQHPSFGGPTRSRLASREVEEIVKQRIEAAYGDHLRDHPQLVQGLLARLS